MLNEVSFPIKRQKTALKSLLQGVLTGPALVLLRFLLVLLSISGLTCLYLWQASTYSDLQLATASLKSEAVHLEQQNVSLMLEVTAWNTPAAILAKANELGMVPAQPATYIQVPVQAGVREIMSQQAEGLAQWWQQITKNFPASPSLTRQLPDLSRLLDFR